MTFEKDGDIALFRRRAIEILNRLAASGDFSMGEVNGLYTTVYLRLVKGEKDDRVHDDLLFERRMEVATTNGQGGERGTAGADGE